MVLGMNSGRGGDSRRSNNQGRKEGSRHKDFMKQDQPPSVTSQSHKHKVCSIHTHAARAFYYYFSYCVSRQLSKFILLVC